MDISRNLLSRNVASKYFTTLLLASSISMVLFYGMHLLIKRDMPLPEAPKVFDIKILKIPKDIANDLIVKAPPPPVRVETRPDKEPTVIDLPKVTDIGPTNPTISPMEDDPNIRGVNLDHNHIAVVPIAPQYPASLAQKCIEGYAITGFTVASSGAVIDSYIITSSHKGFESSSLRAIRKFKFKPKMLDGKPVASPNAKYKFSYKLEDC